MPKATATTPHGVWSALRLARTNSGRTLTGLADVTGYSLSHLSDLERGRRLPSPEAIRRLADALNVPMTMLDRSKPADAAELRDLIREIVREEMSA